MFKNNLKDGKKNEINFSYYFKSQVKKDELRKSLSVGDMIGTIGDLESKVFEDNGKKYGMITLVIYDYFKLI